MITRKTKEELQELIQKSVKNRQVLTLRTYIMTDYGELILQHIISNILSAFQRKDLMDVAYTAAKELIINATKANVKRAIFQEMNLNWRAPEEYKKGMSQFRHQLSEEGLSKYEKKFKQLNWPVNATFYYNEYVLNIKVKNNFPLFPIEEERIRERFKKAQNFSNLVEFYMEHGDNSEGAGLGLTMVSILLEQSEIDRHSFILYSSEKYQETIAKIEIPLKPGYISKRDMFNRLMEKKNMSADELRKMFNYNYKDFLREAEIIQKSEENSLAEISAEQKTELKLEGNV